MAELLTEIDLKKAYDTDHDNVLTEFFIPALSVSTSYSRLAGYYSSTVLAVAARGVSKFIRNQGRMELIIGTELSSEDFEVLKKASTEERTDIAERLLPNDFDDVRYLFKEHVAALGWMVKSGHLEIKFAFVKDRGIFHQKVGILEDRKGNKISFSGSDNETGSAWAYNVEEFKVFRNWVDSEIPWFDSDVIKFKQFWANTSERAVIVDAPSAFKSNLIAVAPRTSQEIQIADEIITNEVVSPEVNKKSRKDLRDYQTDAVNSWFQNGKKGIFTMATGTGKTLTALGAIERLKKENGHYCTVLAVPYKHLAEQWKDDVLTQLPGAKVVVVHSESPGWRTKLTRALTDYGDHFTEELVIITLYGTLSSEEFVTTLKTKLVVGREYTLIADEMHNLGASKNQQGMLEEYTNRLGLSATPIRKYDEDGTEALDNYFHQAVYDYPLKKAIENGLLVKYDYFPIFAELNEEEFEKYLVITKKISRGVHFEKELENNEYVKRLLIERSRIIKSSQNKIEKFEELILRLKNQQAISHLLVYCDQGGQLELAQQILNKHGIINHKFTEEETLEERTKIISNFKNGLYQCLVAVKCLDEGVDIPDVRSAIILASTANPREYIQRRGRVLRKSPGKDKADIYDFIVIPSEKSLMEPNIREIERNFIKREIDRVMDFYEAANNRVSIINEIGSIMTKYGVYLPDLKSE